jgi:integrase
MEVTPPTKHLLMGGKLHLYKRPNSKYWQCSTYLAGKNRRESTGQDVFAHAKEFAEDWYLNLRGMARAGTLKTGKTFAFAVETFLTEFRAMTAGQRSEKYLAMQEMRVRAHLVPFFEGCVMADVTTSKVQEYRLHRAINKWTGRPTARSTLHQEIVALRQILKTAQRHGWIVAMPELSPPYKSSGKIGHRAWFSPDEYRRLYESTRKRAARPLNNRWRWECEQLHDYVLFMANTGLRPDEAARLQFRDVQEVFDDATQETILLIEVRGKRGIGYCKSTTGAVVPFRRLRSRPRRTAAQATQNSSGAPMPAHFAPPKPNELLFPGGRRDLINNILEELDLKFDRDGNRRTAYSLRHTYICLRLTEGADIYQIAKNCRTSVEMIEKHYATHIKTALDAASINVRRPRTAAAQPAKESPPADKSARPRRTQRTAWRKRRTAV